MLICCEFSKGTDQIFVQFGTDAWNDKSKRLSTCDTRVWNYLRAVLGLTEHVVSPYVL